MSNVFVSNINAASYLLVIMYSPFWLNIIYWDLSNIYYSPHGLFFISDPVSILHKRIMFSSKSTFVSNDTMNLLSELISKLIGIVIDLIFFIYSPVFNSQIMIFWLESAVIIQFSSLFN